MQGDCPSYETIDIPDGVSLDGTGKTMTLTQIGLDHTRAIRAVGVASAGLRNLTIDAADAAFAMDDAVRFDVGSGLIENVAILNNDGAFTGFNVEGDVDITSVTVDGTALAGIRYGGTGTISDSTVRNIDDFVLFILDTGDDPATVEDNELTNVGIGVFVAGTANTTTNTIAGRGGGSGESVGVWFDTSAAGSVAGNTISNFRNGASAAEACGIFVAEDAGAVTLGANAFLDPPGNEQDVCDNRP
jgi:nitrous oxidase accessory protein NosD